MTRVRVARADASCAHRAQATSSTKPRPWAPPYRRGRSRQTTRWLFRTSSKCVCAGSTSDRHADTSRLRSARSLTTSIVLPMARSLQRLCRSSRSLCRLGKCHAASRAAFLSSRSGSRTRLAISSTSRPAFLRAMRSRVAFSGANRYYGQKYKVELAFSDPSGRTRGATTSAPYKNKLLVAGAYSHVQFQCRRLDRHFCDAQAYICRRPTCALSETAPQSSLWATTQQLYLKAVYVSAKTTTSVCAA